MRPSFVVPTLFLITTSFISQTSAIEALTNSPCAASCGNVLSATTGSDITCSDSGYTQSVGVTFSGCVSCQLTSKYVDPVSNQTDLQWGLYNLRYAVSWCLFGYPNNTAAGSSPCTTSFACGLLQSGFEYNNLTTNNITEYDYCSDFPQNAADSCRTCLQPVTNEYYLSNFVTLLSGACTQLPKPGATLSFQGSAFSQTRLNMTSPTPSAYISLKTSGLPLGSRIGIAVGAIVAVLFLAGFCIIWNGRRRRRNVLRRRQAESGYAAWQNQQQKDAANAHVSEINSAVSGTGGFWDSPQSQRPLHPQHWGQQQPMGGINTNVNRGLEEESPMSVMGEKPYFSPYSSHYSSPASAAESKTIGQEWPTDRKGSFGQGGGSFLERIERRDRERRKREEEEGDRIEMVNVVAPVLAHPGNGRNGIGKVLTEEDVKQGNAL